MAGCAESVEQVWLLGRVVTVCWLGGRLCSGWPSGGVSRLASVREKRRAQQPRAPGHTPIR